MARCGVALGDARDSADGALICVRECNVRARRGSAGSMTSERRKSTFLSRLQEDRPLVAVELRPPPTDVSDAESVDLWIDINQLVQALEEQDTVIFLTDNAVGKSEEENLRHLTANLADRANPSRIVPFLTCKHSLDYCFMYAARAASRGFDALTVLGGDPHVGSPRCVDHAYRLRQMLRERVPSLTLGGWANPHGNPEQQVEYLLDEGFTAEFYLTQIVSHHNLREVERFLGEARRREVPHPAVFGVFFYRSANPKTLERMSRFFPVPAEDIVREFEAGDTAEEICARTIGALRQLGVDKVYVSNLGLGSAQGRYRRVLEALEG